MSSESEVMHRVSNMRPMWSSLVRFYMRTEQPNLTGSVAHRLKLAYGDDHPDTDWLDCSRRLCDSEIGTEPTDQPEWDVQKGEVNNHVYSATA